MGILGEIIDISAVCVSKLSYLIFFVLQQAVLLLKKTKLELMISIFPAGAICLNIYHQTYSGIITLPAFSCRSLAERVAELRRCVLTLLLPENHGFEKEAFWVETLLSGKE